MNTPIQRKAQIIFWELIIQAMSKMKIVQILVRELYPILHGRKDLQALFFFSQVGFIGFCFGILLYVISNILI